MRYFLLILGVFILLDISYFAYVNQGVALTLNYKPFIPEFTVKSGMLYFLMGLYGFIGGVLIVSFKLITMQHSLKKSKRKTEKSEIEHEESSDKVKNLEAKIKTLEAALKSALEQK